MWYIVENFYTCEIIMFFPTDEQRQKWLKENVNEEGYMEDGTKISIYESLSTITSADFVI